jgi:hypothetical protein
VDAASEYGVTVNCVSQGSGITLLSDGDSEEMVKLGSENDVEVSLFIGPRAAFDTGAQARAPGGGALAVKLRGMDQAVYTVQDVFRAVRHGIRGVLVADEGLLWLLGQMRRDGLFPNDLVIKASVSLGGANPISRYVR